MPREAPRAGAHPEGLEAAQAGKLGPGFLRGSQARPASGAGEPCRQCLISLCPGPHRQEASLCGSGTVRALAGVRQGTLAGEPRVPRPAPWMSRLLLLAYVCGGPLMLVLVLATWPVQVPTSGRFRWSWKVLSLAVLGCGQISRRGRGTRCPAGELGVSSHGAPQGSAVLVCVGTVLGRVTPREWHGVPSLEKLVYWVHTWL